LYKMYIKELESSEGMDNGLRKNVQSMVIDAFISLKSREVRS